MNMAQTKEIESKRYLLRSDSEKQIIAFLTVQ